MTPQAIPSSLRTLVALVTLGSILAGIPPIGQAVGAATTRPVTWEHRGFTLAAYTENGLYDSGAALQQLASSGANSVTFVVTWYTPGPSSAAISRTTRTASDASLVWAIEQAKALGLKVMLKPHLDSQDGTWRARINPANADLWFTNYAALLNRYADIGRQHGVAILCLGAELISMSTNPAYESRWRALIADVRGRFAGALTYSANWGIGAFAEEYPQLPFWDALDYLGISAYFELAETLTPTIAQLVASWTAWRTTKIAPFQRHWNKPVLFTEGGYRSVDGAARQPWNHDGPGVPDPQEQSDLYEALFQSWSAVPWFAGTAFWFWSLSTDVSATGTGYDVQRKPAQGTVAAWFGGSVLNSGPGPQCFPQTGQCVPERFLIYWQEHGGLAINGFPLSPVFWERLEDGQWYEVQYFERVRLEHHLDNAPPYDVLLGQFGRRIRPADPPVAPDPQAGRAYFAQTGHNLGGAFRAFWEANGGLAQFGYPLSEEFDERLEDGKVYRVQYFERARFEQHPENAPPYDVLLGQFGRRILAASAR